jgi:hypothetical protein
MPVDARKADNIRGLLGIGTDAPAPAPGAVGVRRALGVSQAKADDPLLSASIARELAFGSPADRAKLRSMVEQLPPREKASLLASIVGANRDPHSPADAVRLTPHGQMVVDVGFNGVEPDAQYFEKIGLGIRPDFDDVDDPVPTNIDAPAADKLTEKEPPVAPKGANGKRRQVKDAPSFRQEQTVVQGKDGTFKAKDKDGHIDYATKRAIERAKEGKPVAPIYDDPKNAPPGAVNTNALASGTRTPKQSLTQRIQRLAELRDPNGTGMGEDFSIDLEQVGIDGGVEQSAFAPRGSKGVSGRSIATVRPEDYGDTMEAFEKLRRGKAKTPNEQYASAEDFARDLVAGIHQGGFDTTPVTARQRRAATGYVDTYANSPEMEIDRIVDGGVSEATVGPRIREEFPEAANAAKSAERAVIQEQAIKTLARKIEAIYGHNGWGDNYKPSYRPAGTDVASTETGPRPGTTQDPHQVPAMVEHGPDYEATSVNQRGKVDELPYEDRLRTYEEEAAQAARTIKRPDYMEDTTPYTPVPVKPKASLARGLPGSDIDPELTTDDLMTWHNEKVGYDGPEIPGGEAEPVVRTGRAEGDKGRTKPAKTRQEGGNKPGEYQDNQSFAEFNKLHREGIPESDLKTRQAYYDRWHETVEMDPARSSHLRQELQTLLDDPSPVTAERASQIAELQRRVRLSERLDAMSGVLSSKKGGKTKSKPKADPVTGDNPTTPNALAPYRHPEAEPTFDLDGKPHEPEIIDAEFEIKKPVDEPSQVPDEPNNAPETDAEGKAKPNGWKRAAKVAAGLAGGLGIYQWLWNAGQPPAGGGGGGIPVPPVGWRDGGQVGPDGFPPVYRPGDEQAVPSSPGDRIRALRGMNLNPNTQTLQSWTR